MTDQLRELYQEAILDHNRSPRNFRRLEDFSGEAEGHNPLCGDKIHLYVKFDGEKIVDFGFEGSGCAISKASASMMGQLVKGMSRRDIDELFSRFHHLVTAPISEAIDVAPLGKLAVFAGVREFPARVKCAILAWHTLQAALKGDAKPVSTE